MRARLLSAFLTAFFLVTGDLHAQSSLDLSKWEGNWSEAPRSLKMLSGVVFDFGGATATFTARDRIVSGVVAFTDFVKYPDGVTVRNDLSLRISIDFRQSAPRHSVTEGRWAMDRVAQSSPVEVSEANWDGKGLNLWFSYGSSGRSLHRLTPPPAAAASAVPPFTSGTRAQSLDPRSTGAGAANSAEAARQQPAAPSVLLERALALEKNGKVDEAIQELSHALGKPDADLNSEVWFHIGRLQLQMKRGFEAEVALSEALGLNLRETRTALQGPMLETAKRLLFQAEKLAAEPEQKRLRAGRAAAELADTSGANIATNANAGRGATTGAAGANPAGPDPLPALQLEDTIWFCTGKTGEGREFDGFMHLRRDGHAKVAESARRGPRDWNGIIWPNLDPDRNGSREIATLRSPSLPGYEGDRWASTKEEARVLFTTTVNHLYQFRAKSGQLIGTMHAFAEGWGERYAQNPTGTPVWNVGFKEPPFGSITCDRARAWLQR
jgi:hypothetical protein